MNIRTEDQFYGWVAYDEDTYSGPPDLVGVAPWPKTEQDAVDDLCEKLDLPYTIDISTGEKREWS